MGKTVLKYLADDGVTWLPFTGDVPAPTSSIVVKEPITGFDGTKTQFTTSQPYTPGSLQASIRGLPQGSFVTETDPLTGKFTFDEAPASTDTGTVYYHTANTGLGNAQSVNNYTANGTPTPNNLLPLNGDGKFPDSVHMTAVKRVIGTTGNPGYQNGWQHYTAPWGPNYFIKSADGMVTVSIMTRSGSLNTTIFTLPVGFRPGARISCAGRDASGAVLVDVSTDGAVATEAGTSNSWLAFNITFLAEA